MSDTHQSLLARDARVLWHPYSHAETEPELACVVSARGAWLELADGRRVLDAISSWWTCLHGHGTPEIADAIARQARTLDHVLFAGATHEPGIEAAERLVRMAPPGLTRVFYSDDGSTAVEVALKLCLQRAALSGERRRIFVALEGGYHGDTFGAMSVGEDSIFTKPFDGHRFEVARIPAPNGLGDLEGAERALAALERLLGARAREIAGVITEPMLQGVAGMRLQPAAFLRGVRALTRNAGVPWIADEVLTGFGRTGRLFACEHADVSPDLLCVAKGLTGGVLPLAATLVPEDWYASCQGGDRANAFFHGHSFTGNPIACAAAAASLDLCSRPRFLAEVERIGARLEAGLAPLRGTAGIREVRRLGAVAAVELSAGAGYLAPSALEIRRLSLQQGVLLRPLGNVIYAMPPIATTDEECDRIAAVIRIAAQIQPR
ncbi:MAG: adenosylmethionine--8-amino-7-oxononanoate transaminase [Planctomycetes bacterium]|nr:adenosylmethionine--8-amino-7-oxononanoate transaminase [Planctomycetota bacterium]